jgi:hypothetical protein
METLACPADPADLDASLPPVCGYVWKKCIAQPEDTDPDGTNL